MSGLGNKEIMARNIQYYMDMYQKTRQDMCDALGVKYTTFTDWVKGNSYPRIDKIELMANYFGISKADLVEEHSILTSRDTRDIAKDLDRIMEKLQSGESGPASYNGEELDPEAAELFRDELEIALKRLKIMNKEKYTNKRYKK